jgi:hypothetical protein
VKRSAPLRRTPLKRSGRVKAKRNPDNEIPTESRFLVRARDCDICVKCLTALDGGGHWHHRRTRSVHDAHRHCPCVGVLLCSPCHSEVHADQKVSRENGWIVSRYETEPSSVPFKTGEIWVFPMCSGNVHLSTATTLQEAVDSRYAKVTILSKDAANR